MEESKKLLIIDSSVILKWFIDETEGVENAAKIKSDYLNNQIKLGVTNFCFYEVMNTLGRKFPEKAVTSLSVLKMLDIFEIGLTLEIATIALGIMREFPQVSFYDASYHATAIENNGTFITADEKYYRRAKSLKHITLLKDYPISPQ